MIKTIVTDATRASSVIRALGLMGMVLLVAGCGLDDPYDRPGTWTAENLSDRNLALMVAHPRDLVYGANDPVSPGQLSSAAVRRLLTDRVKALPITDVGSVATGAGQASGPAGSAGDGL